MKVYSFIELLTAIKNGEIEEGTEIIRGNETKYIFQGGSIRVKDNRMYV